MYFALKRPDLAGPFSRVLADGIELRAPDSDFASRRRRLSEVDDADGDDAVLARRVGASVSLPPPMRVLLALPVPSCLRRLILGVVGDVPAGALELNRRRRHQLPHRAAAGGAGVDRRIRELLDALEPLLAGLALVLVERHV